MPPLFESLSLSTIRSWLSERHGRELLAVFFIQVFSLLASLVISLIITNLLGAAAYGIYSYGFSWVNLLAVFSCMGFEQLALKELPVYRVQGNQSFIRGYFIFSVRRILVTSIIASIALFAISFAFSQPKDHDLRIGLWLSIPILPVVALLNLRFSWLRSFQFNSLSQLPDKLIRPLVFLLMLGSMVLLMRDQLSVWHVIIISMVSIVVAYFTGNFFLQKKILAGFSDVAPEFDKKNWTRVAFSLFLVSGIYFYLSQLQILSLGFFKGAAETGIFAIASRLSDLEGYMLFALNVVLAPLISKMWAEQRKAELQSVLRKSLWFGFIFSLPVVICFLVVPGFFLNLFGDEFGDGTFVLIVLTLSQIVNFGTGSVGYILTMTGHQKIAIRLLIISALFATLLSVLLVPSFGKNGAALAAAINNVALNVTLAIVVYRKTGINPTLLSFK